jgi:hypothetical protein
MRYDTRHHPIHPTSTRATARRGSTIIVAVGVLAVLALVAVSYAVVVRTDRAGAAAYERGVDLETSGRVVRDEIGAILAADLFGNKVVSPDVPFEAREGNTRIRIWPRMFEDGEFFDVAQTAPGSFDIRNPEQQRQDPVLDNDPWVIALNRESTNVGSFFPSPPSRDDAWLSNTEPFNRDFPSPRDGQDHLQWTTWGQLSNLRSAFRHVTRNPNDQVGVWVRGDGRYADLAGFFLTDFAGLTRRGDPGANLSYPDESAVSSFDEFTGVLNGPLVALSATPVLGGLIDTQFATQVFDKQIHQLEEVHAGVPIDTPEYYNADERFFTDTDGDLRPDARWQTIDALDGLLGLRWVAAARIVDNSALVNVNTAMEFQDFLDPQRVGDGRTPADVDLTRLMRSAHLAPDLRTQTPWLIGDFGYPLLILPPTDMASSYLPLRVTPTTLPPINPINQHLFEQLGLDRFSQSMDANANRVPLELTWSLESGNADDVFMTTDIIDRAMPPQHTTRLQRYFVNRFFGVSPLQPTTERISPYTVADEAELRTFFGLNNSATISKIEQRFDHERLDDVSMLLSGPMRTKESINESRRLATDTTDTATRGLPTTLAIASDTRRHLTTVSGVADFSPVPVLNASEVNGRDIFDRPFNTKLSFTDIPRTSPDPVDPARFERDRKNRRAGVRDAFDAFAWALAPLAGHTPLMAPLGFEHTGSGLVGTNPTDLAKFFYGGDRTAGRGPAATLQQEMIAGGVVNAADAQPGAAYAILRAASLAVNLYDATDDERIVDPTLPPSGQSAPTGETREIPTVARLFNIVHPDPYSLPVTLTGLPLRDLPDVDPVSDSVVHLGASFSWGDLRDANAPIVNDLPASNPALLPIGHVGESNEGVTLVGLDRQPFLRQVYTVGVYADPRVLDPATSSSATYDETIDPNDVSEQIGSIVAWEIGNPWPTAIDVTDLWVAIASGDMNDEVLQAPLSGAPIPAIGPGQSVVFYAVHWKAGDSDAEDYMEAYVANWLPAIVARLNNDDTRARRIEIDMATDRRGLRNGTGVDVPVEGIPFHAWGDGSAAGLLLYPRIDNAGVITEIVPGAGTILIDRLAATAAGIPSVLNGTISLDPADTPELPWTGIASVVGYAYRPTETTAGSGFPAWVLETAENVGERSGDAGAGNLILSTWTSPDSTGFGSQPPDLPGAQGGFEGIVGSPVMTRLGEEDKGTLSIPNFPAFQLFVPNTELRYASEALQLTAFTHMYVHDAAGPNEVLDDFGAVLGAKIGQPDQYGPGTWRTISEQLGSDAEIFRDVPNTIPNPYLGVLDPTRFVLASSATSVPIPANAIGVLGPVMVGTDPSFGKPMGLPEALSVPLALRVVDVVEPLWTPDWRGGSRLVQGRVNINTAAQKTLRMLPLVDPQDPIDTLQRQSDVIANDWRVPMIMAYRDRVEGPSTGIGAYPAKITGFFGADDSPLRFADFNAEPSLFAPGGESLSRGFVTPGELAILGRWDAANPGNPGIANPNGLLSFLQLATNTAVEADIAVPALDVRRRSSPQTGDPGVDDVRPTPIAGGSIAAYEGMDDVEERLAIYRAVSNIVTARSDVYTAYFKVRGYAPRDIEAVTIKENPSDQQLGDYLDELRPRFEARYLAVYDRSTVRTPVDRPKVLLFVRLPD